MEKTQRHLEHPSRGQSTRHLGNSLASLDVAVVQAQSKQFLETGVDSLVHGGILGSDVGQLFQQADTALVVVPLGSLETLTEVRRGLGGLDRTSLGVDGASALHSRGRSGTSDSPLTASGFLLLDLASAGRSLGRAVALGGGIVVDTAHVVVEVPSPGESIAWHGTFAALP